MSRILSFEYSRSYLPSAPFVEVEIDGYNPEKEPIKIAAFVDSGADGTMLPQDLLTAIDAEYEDTVLLKGTAGGVQRLDRYTVHLHIANQDVHAIAAVAIASNSEPIIGRDVLNAFIITLNGPAETTELQIP